MDAGPKAYAILFPLVERQPARALPLLHAELLKGLPGAHATAPEEAKDRLATRQARAAIALVRLGRAEAVWTLLRHGADPRLRSFIVNWLDPLGADPRILAAELAHLDSVRRGSPDPADRPPEGLQSSIPRGDLRSPPGHGLVTLPRQKAAPQEMDVILFHPATSIRRALILALGTYGTERLSPGEWVPLVARLLDLYHEDPDAGIHGAAEWTLRRWGQQERLTAADADLSRLADRGRRRWYVNGLGQTFVLIEGPVEFRMGSPPDDPDRFANETPHQQPIPRRFAIATKEVTLAHFREFSRKYPQYTPSDSDIQQYGLEPDCPSLGVSWFMAAAYCNWLSVREGIPQDQWCYLPDKQGQYAQGMRIPANALRRTGYRLATEAEWEYVCRAGTLTSRYYGGTLTLLDRYAWYLGNLGPSRVRPCGQLLPNDLGLFDMLGNVYEWCQERPNDRSGGGGLSIEDIMDDSPRPIRGGMFAGNAVTHRSANRDTSAPASRRFSNGFRLARTLP
jgi:formylglycine-generating enzyme required for sulfatase activity